MNWLKSYFRAAYVPIPGMQSTTEAVRGAMKWWLDFVRNTLVIATLYFLATKTSSPAVGLFAALSATALIAYTLSYISHVQFFFMPFIKNPTWHRWINNFLWGAFWAFCYFVLSRVVEGAFAGLTAALAQNNPICK